MEDATFIEATARRVKEIAGTYRVTDDRAFLVWAASLLWGLEEDDAVEAIVDGPNDKSVDLFWYDDISDRIVVAQGKYSRQAKRHPSLKDLSAFPSCLGWLAKPEALRREGLPDLADAGRQFLELRERDVPVELWFVHFSRPDANLEKEAEVFNQTERNQAERVQLRVASLHTLRAAFEDLEDAEARVPQDSLPARWVEQQVGAYGPALVATVKGKDLAELYSRHGNRLFVRNVRLYLGERQGSVNRGIANTLRDPEDRANFWAYNNGVTIVCHRFEYRPDRAEIKLWNFSVVNGCQTTVLLHRAGEALGDDVEVLAKIVNPNNLVIDRIIEFTNSQNQIRTWDIKSQDRVQRRLKQDLEGLPTPFFYAIRKGEFEALSGARKKRYRPDDGQRRAIQFDSLTQYLAAFHGKAYYAYKFKARLFENLYREIFPEDLGAKEVLFVWQVGEMVRGFVRKMVAEATTKEDQEKLRILKKGCRIYLCSVVDLLLRLRNGDTYLQRVADGRAFGANRREKLYKYLQWAFDWYEEAVGRLVEDGRQDINTLVRQEDFIDRVIASAKREFQRTQRARKYFEEAFPLLVAK